MYEVLSATLKIRGGAILMLSKMDLSGQPERGLWCNGRNRGHLAYHRIRRYLS